MKLIKAINNYFFLDEEIAKEDGAWFYGAMLIMVSIFVYVLIAVY